MALVPETAFPGQIKPATPEYPYGEAQNITTPGDGKGTPFKASLVNDIFGWQQALLSAADIVPSGLPEKATASQYLEAMNKINASKAGKYTTPLFDTVLSAKDGTLVGGGSYTFVQGQVVETVAYGAWAATSIGLPQGGARYIVVAGGTGTDDGFLYHNLTDGSGFQLELLLTDRLDITTAGVTAGGSGTSNHTQAAAVFLAQATVQKPIYVPQAPVAYAINGQLEYQGFGLYGDNANTSKLEYSGSGVFIKKQQSNDFGRIHDLWFNGPGKMVVGSLCFGHDGNTRGWFRTQMKNVRINAFAQAFEIQFSLFCTFETVFIRDCARGFFFVGGGTGWNNTWYNNEITFINCIWDDCSEYAIDFVGTGLSFAGTNTMQSGGDGIRIIRDDGGRSNVNTLDNLYFEFNTGKDIDLKDTYVSMGPVMFQSGPTDTPGHNIFADNSKIYATGRPAFLDNPALRIELTNGSQYVAMFNEIVSNKIIADATSEYVYIPTRLADKRLEQTFTGLGTTPVQLSPPIGTSARYTNHVVEFMIEAPNGEYTSFKTYGKSRAGSFRTNVDGDAAYVSDFEFTVSIGGFIYTFRTSAPDGSMTIEADATAAGNTKLTTRVTDSRSEALY